MIVTINTKERTVTISDLTHFGELVDWEEYLDYEVILKSDNQLPLNEYLDKMKNPSHT